MQPLPIDPLLPEIVARVRESSALVLEAEPGAGKTTRVPRALLDGGLLARGEVLVLEPRRLAARLAARRVAEELGEKVGETAGYQVRFEDVSSKATRIRFVTDGVLTRRLLRDPDLAGVTAVIADEFHERRLESDVCLALLARLQKTTRPDLKLIVMSATLDATPVQAYLGAKAMRAPGRRFEVALDYATQLDTRPLHTQIANAVTRLAEGNGHILVFLPGAGEIRRALESCEAIAKKYDLALLPLHGDLSPEAQDRVVKRDSQRKVILSTNVAESSVTIDGVGAVVDSGLARVAACAVWSGLTSLRVQRVSKASATQRAGRAGRTQVGRCLRLYTLHDFQTRPDHEEPEIRRLDLAQTALELHAEGIDPRTLAWFEAPSRVALDVAETLLVALGAIDVTRGVTSLGRRMLRLPLHPRLSRLVLEAETRGAGREGALLAALLSERAHTGDPFAVGRRATMVTADSDPIELMEAHLADPRNGTVDRVHRQIVRNVTASTARGPAVDAALRMALLAAFPDRVARRRTVSGSRAPSREFVFARGGGAQLAETSAVRDAEFLVAVDAQEEPRGVLVRSASAIDPDWLLDIVPSGVEEKNELLWNERLARVEAVSRVMFGNLVLDERQTTPEPKAAARLLFERARSDLAHVLGDRANLDRFVLRVNFVAIHLAEVGIEPFSPTAIENALAAACLGHTRFDELNAEAIEAHLRGKITPRQLAQLDELAPEQVTLAAGRRVRVTYESNQPPWVASRLQDFFGMARGPAIAKGRVPLVLHLLAPNQRPVQVTTDLAGFWIKHYPALRKELMRRYPRHAWPEKP